MIAGARAMALRLWRAPVLAATLGVSALFAVVATVLSFDDAGQPTAAGPGPSTTHTVADLQRSDGLVAGLHSATNLLGVVSIAICAWAIATDFSTGTIRNLLVRRPQRSRLLGGHLLALAALLAAAAALALVASVAAAFLVAPGQGISTGSWTLGAALTGGASSLAAMLGYGAMGAALAILLRSPAAAIAIGVAYALPIETLLGSAGSWTDHALPGKLLTAIAETDASTAQVATAAAWILAALAAALVLFSRRDVTQ